MTLPRREEEDVVAYSVMCIQVPQMFLRFFTFLSFLPRLLLCRLYFLTVVDRLNLERSQRDFIRHGVIAHC